MPRPPKKNDRNSEHRGKPPGRRKFGRPAAGRNETDQGRKPPRKRPMVPRPPGEPREGDRLQKVLAAAGLASRRECEQLILEGRVQVDGEVITELGAKVDRVRQEIRVDGEPLPRPKLQYFAVHKPPGVVSTARDPAGRPRVIDLLPPGVGRMFNVGRLDLASEGLIIVTNDGMLAQRLTHPSHGVEKVYDVQVAGVPEPDVLAQVKRGVHLAEGFVHAVDVRVKSKKKGSTLLEMVLDEGRNREIRRLLARLGHKVQRLVRVAVGPVRLGEMPRGAVRMLTPEEVRKLREAAEAGPREGAESVRPRRPQTGAGRPRKPGGRPGGGPPKPFNKKKAVSNREEGAARRIIGEDVPTPPAAPGRPAKPGGKRPFGAGRPGGGPGKRPGGGGPFKGKRTGGGSGKRPGGGPGKRPGGPGKRPGRGPGGKPSRGGQS